MELINMEQTTAILPSCYLPPIQYFSKLLKYDHVILEHFEHFPKQTYRNRCCIYGANGKLSLSIPLQQRTERTLIKDIKISYDSDWQKLHWRSIESSYRRSPYFEFYEDDFIPFYTEKQFHFLLDFNEAMMNKVNLLLKIKPEIHYTKEYKKEYENDFRTSISPKSILENDTEFN